MEEFRKQKVGNVPGVMFGSDDVLEKYEAMLRVWPASTLDISVKRLTGDGSTHTIKSRPRSGHELYEAILSVHGQNDVTEYEVKCFDTTSKQYRIHGGRIKMPDTRPPTQQGQPAPMLYPPPGYPPQPPYSGYQAPQQPAAPAAPAHPAPAPAVVDPMAMMGQLLQMLPQIQQLLQPQPQPQVAQPPPPPPQMPPMPPASDPGAMLVWLQQAVQTIQQIQSTAQPHPAPQQPPPYQPQQPPQQQQPPMPQGPTRAAPPGMAWIWEPGYGFVLSPVGGTTPSTPMSPMARGPRPSYYNPQRDDQPHREPQREAALPPPRTAAQQFQDSISTIRTTVEMMRELNDLIPGADQSSPSTPSQESDSPIAVIPAGPAKIVVNTSDGSLRLMETAFANMGPLANWVGEQHKIIQRAAADRQRQQQPQQQLQGHAVVEEAPGTDLPPPPEDVPPPIHTGRRTWEPPTIPER